MSIVFLVAAIAVFAVLFFVLFGRLDRNNKKSPPADEPPAPEAPQPGKPFMPPAPEASQPGKTFTPPAPEASQPGKTFMPPAPEASQPGKTFTPPAPEASQPGKTFTPPTPEAPQPGKTFTPPAGSGRGGNPGKLLIKSRFYKDYRFTFDFVNDSNIREDYKIDWLLYSLNLGRELETEGYYVRESVKSGLPYFAETEEEFDNFFKLDKPVLRGSVSGMMDICFYYHDVNTATSHPMKRKYWQDSLVAMAESGNFEAQGALCSNYAAAVFSKEQSEEFKARYLGGLMEAANAGDHMAELAVGEFIAPYRSSEKIEWLIKAAQGNLTDACFLLTEAYKSYIEIGDDLNVRAVPLSPSERKKYEDSICSAWYTGAKANNGLTAGLCQWRVAEYYVDGGSPLGQDIETAKKWYKMSYDNGFELSGKALDHLNGK